MSWEDEGFNPLPAKGGKKEVKDSWEDEDSSATGIQIKGSWEDEDVAAPEPVKPKSEPKKPAAKPAAKKPAPKPVHYESTGDPVADKLREQRLVEEADYQNVEDMFGLSKEKAPAAAAVPEDDVIRPTIAEKREPDLLDSRPKTEAEFENFAAQLAKKLSVHDTSFHYPYLIKSLTKHLCTSLPKTEDVKDLISALNVIVNDKLQAAKPKAKAKKAAGPTQGKKVYKDAFDDDFDAKGKSYDDDYDDFM